MATLLNATLVIPKFLFSNVWNDPRSAITSIMFEICSKSCVSFYLIIINLCQLDGHIRSWLVNCYGVLYMYIWMLVHFHAILVKDYMVLIHLDCSQFGDIYQEEHFINSLKDEVDIVKETPSHLHSVDLEATGSLVWNSSVLTYFLINYVMRGF